MGGPNVQQEECQMRQNPWVSEVVYALEDQGSPTDAIAMSAYMKNRFRFLGIKKPRLKELTKALFEKNALPSPEDIPRCIQELWMLEEREYHMVALELLRKWEKKLTPKDLEWIQPLILEHSWWDSVDFIATHAIGVLREKYPETMTPILDTWILDDHLWINRSAIICQVLYRKKTDTDLLERAILPHRSSREFFLRKAIGWALRAYAQENPRWVLGFVDAHREELSGLSIREALKHFS